MSIILDILTGAFATTLEAGTIAGLEKVYTDDGPVYYEALVRGAYPTFNGFLKILASKTKTKIDDRSYEAIADGIRTSAAAHGINLDAAPSVEVIAKMQELYPETNNV